MHIDTFDNTVLKSVSLVQKLCALNINYCNTDNLANEYFEIQNVTSCVVMLFILKFKMLPLACL